MIDRINSNDIALLRKFLNSEETLPEDEFEEVLKHLKIGVYKKGEYLLQQGEIETKTAVILEGVLHQFHLVQGDELTINIALSGTAFNSHTSFILGAPSEQIQRVVKDLRFAYLEKNDIERIMKSNPAFSYIIFKKYAIVRMEKDIRAYILQHKSANTRFELFATRHPQSDRYIKEISQKFIAKYLGMSPEAYSRAKSHYFKHN